MEKKIAKVYLDNCCFNRPYDDQSDPKVHLESQAKMLVQDMIRLHRIELFDSSVLDYEISRSPYSDRRVAIVDFIKEYSSKKILVSGVQEIADEVHSIMETGVKIYDAYHVACAIYAGCDYFLSTDKRLLKYTSDKIKIMNPIDFIREMENYDD